MTEAALCSKSFVLYNFSYWFWNSGQDQAGQGQTGKVQSRKTYVDWDSSGKGCGGGIPRQTNVRVSPNVNMEKVEVKDLVCADNDDDDDHAYI